MSRRTRRAHVPSTLRLLVVLPFTAAALAACGDAASTSPTAPPSARANESGGRGDFQRYVAIGTSVSMGWRSDGVFADFQETSWPAQLARMAGREMSLPLIADPGCRSPLVAPLAAGVRRSGEAAATPAPLLSCAPLLDGVVLPAQNLAINAALTRDALFTTPENVTDASNARLYSRVLPSGATQVSAMIAQNPKIVSVEFGANELLGAREGAYQPGVTVVPTAYWEPQYMTLLDDVQGVAQKAVLAGLVDRVEDFPAFRTGAELYAARATFAPFNVAVSTDCDGSTNLLFVPVRVPVAVANGVGRARAGLGPYTLSCANAPSSTGIKDYVLDVSDVAAIDAQLAAMDAIILREANARGFAYFRLNALYGETVTKAPFNAVTLMTSAEPYGPYVSLDGVHPSAAGAEVIAHAAAAALNARYDMGIGTSPNSPVLP
ncbi:MAG TPA: hypothetical protein VFJ74_10910 [Gemmatimonadaceae bacterium]|nr:hypothetical protein [Gemmatimonadaceae bacterium]